MRTSESYWNQEYAAMSIYHLIARTVKREKTSSYSPIDSAPKEVCFLGSFFSFGILGLSVYFVLVARVCISIEGGNANEL